MGEGSGPAAYGGDPVPAMPFGGGAPANTGHGPQRQGGPRACRTDAPAANNGPGPMGQDGGEMPPERRGRQRAEGPQPSRGTHSTARFRRILRRQGRGRRGARRHTKPTPPQDRRGHRRRAVALVGHSLEARMRNRGPAGAGAGRIEPARTARPGERPRPGRDRPGRGRAQLRHSTGEGPTAAAQASEGQPPQDEAPMLQPYCTFIAFIAPLLHLLHPYRSDGCSLLITFCDSCSLIYRRSRP